MAYEDFAPTQIIDGFIFSKDEDGRLATLKNTKDTDSFILAKTNNLSLLSELYKYATYVNAELRNSYVERAKGELENFNKKSRQIENEVNSLNEQIKKIKEKPYSKATISERMYMNSSERIHQLQDKVGGKDRAAAMQVYISSVEDGSNLLNIYPPTLPEKISLKSSILILIYGILGIMLGIFFLMIKRVFIAEKTSMKIVVVSGGFDPVHSGHIAYFKAARKLGDKLIVALNSDAWLLNKKAYCFMPFVERKLVIENLACVDNVISFKDDDNGSASNALIKIKELYPADNIIFANGGDRNQGNIAEMSVKDIEFAFGVGGDDKKNSSSWILKKWKYYNENRIWGSFSNLFEQKQVKVKELIINPGKGTSFQNTLKEMKYG
jgi:D-beta-D-heptose 7-phosphate kinase/D-beta-D-heptose 1-phosphate adenosyltransferase